RLRLRDDLEVLFEIRNQLLCERIAVWSVVSRIHCVGIITEGCWMLKGNRDHPRKIVRHPGPSEFVTRFPGASAQAKLFLFFCFGDARRFSSESKRRAETEVTLNVNRRILLTATLAISLRQ